METFDQHKDKLIKEEHNLKIGFFDLRYLFLAKTYGTLELYKNGFVAYFGPITLKEYTIRVARESIFEVGILSDIISICLGYIRGFYIKFKDSDTETVKKIYVSCLGAKGSFKVAREAWTEAFKSIGVNVKDKFKKIPK